MTPIRVPLALVVLVSLILAACGGGGSGMPDASSVPTATPPAELPEPIIIGEMAPVGEPETYVVEPGDTLFGIAEKLGVDPDEIIRLNELADASTLEVGQVLQIPAEAPPPGGPVALPDAQVPEAPLQPAGEGEDTYTIQSGDNASAIADSCGFTLDDLAAANGTTIEGLRSLEVGQVLSLPGPCVVPEPVAEEVPAEEVPPEVTEPPPEEPALPPEEPTLPPEATEVPPDVIEPTAEAPTPAPEPGTEEAIPTASP